MLKKIYNHPYLFFLVLIFVVEVVGCKKATIVEDEMPESPLSGTRFQFSLDSIYLYSKHTYLWGDALPGYSELNPRKYTFEESDLLNFKKLVFDISQYKGNPLTGLSYEKTNLPGLSKYSYIENSTAINSSAFKASLASAGETKVSAVTSGKTGYLSLSQFADMGELGHTLNEIFSMFSKSGVDNLIIDIRDNRGGYVETAQYLANLISRPDMTKKTMYAEHFNAEMQQGKAKILSNLPYSDENGKPVYINNRRATYFDINFTVAGNTAVFEKTGDLLNLKKIYFVVNENTASASELLINVLRPYFSITIIGSKTYGKPVGSFGIRIDRYTLYMTNFQIKNANGEGEYFDGIAVDVPIRDEELGSEPDEVLRNVMALTSHNESAIATKANKLSRTIQSKIKLPSQDMIKQRITLK